jgi:hypothetical protein
MSNRVEIKHYKVKSILDAIIPNSVFYVKGDNDSTVRTYITDLLGTPYPLQDLSGGTGGTGIVTLTSTDSSITITGTASSKNIQVSSALQTLITSAIQNGDLISSLVNDSGYITLADIPTIDATPTDGSANAVSSNGVFDALATKVEKNTAITGATKTKITYDSKGLVTNGADLLASDIPNIAISQVTNLSDTLNSKQTNLGFTPEDSANKSTSTSDSASSVKFPVWSAILSYFDVTRIKTILGITTLSGSNTGDDATNSQYSGLATSKQDTLVSGTNIKTINGNSILGSGDIVISGSGITAEEAIGYALIFG